MRILSWWHTPEVVVVKYSCHGHIPHRSRDVPCTFSISHLMTSLTWPLIGLTFSPWGHLNDLAKVIWVTQMWPLWVSFQTVFRSCWTKHDFQQHWHLPHSWVRMTIWKGSYNKDPGSRTHLSVLFYQTLKHQKEKSQARLACTCHGMMHVFARCL